MKNYIIVNLQTKYKKLKITFGKFKYYFFIWKLFVATNRFCRGDVEHHPKFTCLKLMKISNYIKLP